MGGRVGGLVVGIACAVACALVAPPASAERRALETILQDDAQLLHGDDDQVREALTTIKELGADRVRLTAGWSVLTRDADSGQRPSFDATDPAAYEQERWRELDRAVRMAAELGLGVMIDVGFWAPTWAAADGGAPRARTGVDPAAFADFSVAVARRYSGEFAPPAGPALDLVPARDAAFLDQLLGTPPRTARSVVAPAPGPLPRVDLFTLWNEPNHPGFLKPQWRRVRGRLVAASPHLYRAMVAAAYPAIKAQRPDAKVLVGATSALGDHSGRGVDGVPPLRFVRELACVDRRLRPRRTGACRGFARVPGDGWSHHPYSLNVAPGTRGAAGRDDARIGELDRLTALLGRLAARRRLARGLRTVYVTEYGYETRTPRFAPAEQARFLTWAEYLAWRNPRVRTFAQFLLRDVPRAGAASKRRALGQWESGLLFADGRPKPAALAFRAGLHAERGARGLRLWGRVRGAEIARGWLEARRPGGPWRKVATRPTKGGAATTSFLVRRGAVVDRTSRPRSAARWRLVVRSAGRVTASVPVLPVR